MIVNLFAGGGGWDLAARALGVDPVGVEIDPAARATRAEAGLLTHPTRDVRDLDPLSLEPVTGLIASPPCQTFSTVRRGAADVDLDALLAGVDRLRLLDDVIDDHGDERTGLVLEPLRWALALRPEWVAWEQVPPVQPLWYACAQALREVGYSAWSGLLRAETFGVPQVRKRAVLVASRTRTVARPAPTHSRFHARTPAQLDPGVLPWVSMKDAIGRGEDRPAATVLGRDLVSGVRVTVEEASLLQSFPADYFWAGNRDAQHQQVGNAIPPLLARHVLAVIL